MLVKLTPDYFLKQWLTQITIVMEKSPYYTQLNAAKLSQAKFGKILRNRINKKIFKFFSSQSDKYLVKLGVLNVYKSAAGRKNTSDGPLVGLRPDGIPDQNWVGSSSFSSSAAPCFQWCANNGFRTTFCLKDQLQNRICLLFALSSLL